MIDRDRFTVSPANARLRAHGRIVEARNAASGLNAPLAELVKWRGHYALSDRGLAELATLKAHLEEAAADVAAILDAQARTDRSAA